MVQQTFNEVLIKMRELVPMMLVYLAQNALGAMLIQLRQRVELNKLTQLLRHHFTFNHKVADKPGAVSQLQRFQQHALGIVFTTRLPVKLVQQQQVTVQVAHQTQAARVLVQLFQHNLCGL